MGLAYLPAFAMKINQMSVITSEHLRFAMGSCKIQNQKKRKQNCRICSNKKSAGSTNQRFEPARSSKTLAQFQGLFDLWQFAPTS